MNPKRWKWYTWLALVYFAINFYLNFNGVPGEAIISVFVSGVVWFFPVSYTHLTLPTNREV